MKKTILLFQLIGFCFAANAQLNPIAVSIPMRDGKLLAADVYLPNNDSLPRPTILIQTPYNKNFYHGLGLPVEVGFNINTSPFNFVIVDWRCFYGSTAACTTSVNRGQDGFDCVDWISQQPWSNDSIGTWGPSALGLIQFQTAKENPPHLVCAVPIVAGMRSDYERYFPGGVYRTEYVQMLDALGYGLSTVLLAHPVHDIYWTFAESSTFYPSAINVPMFMIGGWYDHATEEVLESFEGIRTQSPVSVRTSHKLLMGPWTHNSASAGLTNAGQLAYPEAAHASDSLARLFFNYYLLNQANGWNSRPVVEYFQMGENNWHSATSWNNSGLSDYDLYFHIGGSMELNVPQSASDSLVIGFDPHDPSPTVGGPTLLNTLDQGPYDQAPAVESRSDILTFTTTALSQDVVMRGRPTAHLKVSSDRTDTDFSIRLTDVYPDGRSMLLLDGIRRMRFRNGYDGADTSDIIPGNIYPLDVNLFANSAITFLAGHQIRVDVTSSNYPRFDVNLNNGQAMYIAGDTLAAQNTLYLNATNASYITLPLENFPSGINETAIDDFEIYPNPNTGAFTVHGSQFTADQFSCSMTDMLGNEVLISPVFSVNSEMITVNLPPGIYVLHIRSADKLFTRKICIVR